MTKLILRGFSVAIWLTAAVLAGGVFYLNHYTPRGPMYDTGEVVCMNDGNGPCGEQFKEDVRGLNLPGWAKWLKQEDSLLLIIFLVLLGAFVSDKASKAGASGAN